METRFNKVENEDGRIVWEGKPVFDNTLVVRRPVKEEVNVVPIVLPEPVVVEEEEEEDFIALPKRRRSK